MFYNHKTPTQYLLDLKRNKGNDYTKVEGVIEKVLLKYYDNLEEVKACHKTNRNELLNEHQSVSISQDIKDNL